MELYQFLALCFSMFSGGITISYILYRLGEKSIETAEKKLKEDIKRHEEDLKQYRKEIAKKDELWASLLRDIHDMERRSFFKRKRHRQKNKLPI